MTSQTVINKRYRDKKLGLEKELIENLNALFSGAVPDIPNVDRLSRVEFAVVLSRLLVKSKGC